MTDPIRPQGIYDELYVPPLPADAPLINPPVVDPIASRIDTYQADLARLEANFASAREALHSQFKADIAALVHPAIELHFEPLPEEELQRRIRQGIQSVIGKGMERNGR